MKPNSLKLKPGLSGARWQLAVCDEALLRRLEEETGEPRLLLRCLINRGLIEATEVRRFLAPDFPAQLHSPRLLRDMELAVERLRRAVREREKVMIVTDFDVDGTTSSLILSHALRLIGGGGLTSCYIPDRFTEGYGLSSQIVERAAEAGCRVMITADIGIKSHAEAQLARQLGIDLIICDHHLPEGAELPSCAYAVLCPKGASGTAYPNKQLAACGVALKLADALLEGHRQRRAILESFAKLAAIGTIADLVDLSTIENRAIVAHGLRHLSGPHRNHGLRALLEVSRISSPPTTYDIGFKIGPRINAAGRIAHASTVLSLFNAQTAEEAQRLAQQLDQLNSERQQIQAEMVSKLMASIDPERLDRVLVFGGPEREGYHRGVVGIVCSKIVDATGRPTLIYSINDQGVAHGSARSISGFHIVEALASVSDLLLKYGGHPMAAGFALPAARLEEFEWRLNQYAAQVLSDEDLGRKLTADAELLPEQVNLETARALSRLEPHGIGNPTPLFLLASLPLRAINPVKEKHLRLYAGSGKHVIEAMWWNAAQYQHRLARDRVISLMGQIEITSWGGETRARLRVRDVAVE